MIRVDRVEGGQSLPDFLVRGKRAIAVNPKVPSGLNLLRKMIQQSDVLIDPFRPGVMERLGLGPDVFLGEGGLNDSLVYARLSGCVYHLRGFPAFFQTCTLYPQVSPERYVWNCVRSTARSHGCKGPHKDMAGGLHQRHFTQ